MEARPARWPLSVLSFMVWVVLWLAAGFCEFVYFREYGIQIFPECSPGYRINAVAYAVAFHLAFDQAGGFQRFQVLGNGGLGEGKLPDEVVADTCIYFEEVVYDGDARRVAQGFSHSCQVVL